MDLTTILILVLGAVLIVLMVSLLVAIRRNNNNSPGDRVEAALLSLKSEIIEKQVEGLLTLRDSLDKGNSVLTERLSESNLALERRLGLFGEIENSLGKLTKQTESIEAIGRDIQSLSDLLQPPKLRGGVGEIMLENLLAQILPTRMYRMQEQIADGQRVDAVIQLGERVLPIDSKFPLESFQRLGDDSDGKSAKEFSKVLKKQIDSIATKYLRPDLGTTDFAIMYIPAEAVYHRFISDAEQDGFEYALSKKKIIPSSPGHLYGFLASVAAIYRQAGLDKGGRQLGDALASLAESLARLERLHERIDGSHRSMGQALTKASQETTQMTQKLTSVQEPEHSSEQNQE